MFGNPRNPPSSQPAGTAPPAAPPPAAPNTAQLPASVWALVDGNSVQMAVADLAKQPGSMQVYDEAVGTWGTLDQFRAKHGLVPAGPAAPPRPSGPGPAPTQQRSSGFGRGPAAPSAGAQAGGARPPAQYGAPRAANRNPYAGVEAAQVGEARNPYLSPGKYVVHIVHSKYHSGRTDDFQILEMDVLLSEGEQALAVGTRATIMIKKNDSFLSNIKEVVIAASGFDAQGNPRSRDSDVTAEECGQYLNGDEHTPPAVIGALMYIEAASRPTRQGTPFTLYNYWPCRSMGSDANGTPIPDTDSIPR